MYLASGNWTSWPGWGPLGVIVAIVVGALLIWLTWKLVFSHQQLYYSVQMTPLVGRGSGFTSRLRIYYGGAETPLAKPVAVGIRFASRSAKDIPTAAFDDRKPIALDLGIPVVAILGDVTSSETIAYSDNKVFIGPCLIRKDEIIRLDVLVDGQPTIQVTSPLIDVKLKERPWSSSVSPWWKDKDRRWSAILNLILTFLLIGLVVFLVATNPSL